MSPTADALLRSWPFDPWLALALVISGFIYLRGWLALRRRDQKRWHAGQPAALLAGLAAIYLALASPIDPFAGLFLQVHMLQHLLLTMVAPPLIWLGAPLLPMLRGLPRDVRAVWVGPLVRWRPLRKIFIRLTQPLVAWCLFVGATWFWHLPRAYELALERSDWHFAEHVCFLGTALLFWYPVVRPYPSRPRWSSWLLFPYLILADVQNTVLAAWLTFSSDVLYPHYEQVPRVAGISALDDQATAGVLMWVPGSVLYLMPLVWLGLKYLSPVQKNAQKRSLPGLSVLLPIIQSEPRAAQPPAFDLLRVPLAGQFLRWRHGRLTLQVLMAILAAAVIFDGLRGPQAAPMNLAGVLPWIHWRGALIITLLVAGNFFCMACPFTLPRAAARRWLPGGRTWPRALRNKWLAVLLVGLFLWSYEAFALWDSPWITAWIVVGYFLAALVIDGFFRDAAFCKYVCPIGQFNFVQSLVSPWEVKVREPAVCATCRSKECIRGSATVAGCQLHLFQPRKSGNLDCTFCLDCVNACPHQNVGVLAVVPGAGLWSDRVRSGIGRFSRRTDLAALVLVLVFGSLANAAGMVAPVVEWQDRVRVALGSPSQFAIITLFYAVALIALPIAAVGAAAAASRQWSGTGASLLATATRFSYALVPIGFAMWMAHYSLHLLTSFDTIVPTTQRFVADLGWPAFGEPLWQLACCRPIASWVPHFQILILDLGLLLSLYTAFRIAENQSGRTSQAVAALVPWAMLILLLFVAAVWIVYQPMEMRGTMAAAG